MISVAYISEIACPTSVQYRSGHRITERPPDQSCAGSIRLGIFGSGSNLFGLANKA
jgi:hypothetical protein